MQGDEPLRTEDMVGSLNNLEVCKCTEVSVVSTESISSAELAKMVM